MELIRKIQIEPHFAGHYRLEYDGKYITLFGWDNNHPVYDYYTNQYLSNVFNEMVLVPVVIEIRNANPIIKEVTDKDIIIEINQQKD